MKKRILFIMLAVVLALSVGIMGCNGGQQEEEEEEEEEPRTAIELSFITFWPSGDFMAGGEGSPEPGTGFQCYMDTIEDRVLAETDDYEISWTAYYAGTEPSPELYAVVRDGAYDIAATGAGYSPGVFPLCEIMNAAGLPYRKNSYTMSLTKQALYDWSPDLQAEMEAQNLHLCCFWSVGPGSFLMTPGNEVRTTADFPGKTIRAATLGSVWAIEALHGTALQCSMDEAKEKFEAGLIEGILCPPDTPRGFGLAEFVQHLTTAPFAYDFVFMQVMNQDTYDGLPAEVRTIFDEVNEAMAGYYGQLRTWGEYDGLVYCRENIDGWTEYDVTTEDPDEYAAWVDALQPTIDDYIGDDATKQALWDKYLELDEYYATTTPYSTWTHSHPTPPPCPSF